MVLLPSFSLLTFLSLVDLMLVLLPLIKKVPLHILYLLIISKGRLKQVEYAMEAINKAGSAIGVLTPAGIILATEKQTVSALLEQSTVILSLQFFEIL